MIELIKGQTVSIDNHDRANRQPILFDYRIHIHKRMNRDKHSGIEVFLYLDTDKDMRIKNKKGKEADVASLRSEMEKAFKDTKKRIAFVRSLLKELNRKCTYSSFNEKLKANLLSAENIARQFGLHKMYKQPLKNDEDTFETIHQDDDGNEYFVLQDFQGKTIRIGDSKDIVENWDKLFSK